MTETRNVDQKIEDARNRRLALLDEDLKRKREKLQKYDKVLNEFFLKKKEQQQQVKEIRERNIANAELRDQRFKSIPIKKYPVSIPKPNTKPTTEDVIEMLEEHDRTADIEQKKQKPTSIARYDLRRNINKIKQDREEKKYNAENDKQDRMFKKGTFGAPQPFKKKKTVNIKLKKKKPAPNIKREEIVKSNQQNEFFASNFLHKEPSSLNKTQLNKNKIKITKRQISNPWWGKSQEAEGEKVNQILQKIEKNKRNLDKKARNMKEAQDKQINLLKKIQNLNVVAEHKQLIQ